MNCEQTQARVKTRIAGRKMAKELLSLVDECNQSDQHYMAAMIQEFARAAGMILEAKREVTPDPKPLPFERLRHMEIPFGKYHGQILDAVPLNYLDWLCQEQEQFLGFLRPYLSHPALKDHIRDYDRK